MKQVKIEKGGLRAHLAWQESSSGSSQKGGVGGPTVGFFQEIQQWFLILME